jgi:hypothetical protein
MTTKSMHETIWFSSAERYGKPMLKRSVIKGTPPSFVSDLLAEGRRRALIYF